MDGMTMNAGGKNQQPGQALLLEADFILDCGQNVAAQAIQLLDQTVRNLALPQEALEKIHMMVSDATQGDDGDKCAGGDIRFHISVTESYIQSPPQTLDIRNAMKDAPHTWGMFLVQHSETNAAGSTRLLIELRLYREIG